MSFPAICRPGVRRIRILLPVVRAWCWKWCPTWPPCGILDVAHYYAALLQMLDTAVTGGFLSAEARALVLRAETPIAVLEALARSSPALARALDAGSGIEGRSGEAGTP